MRERQEVRRAVYATENTTVSVCLTREQYDALTKIANDIGKSKSRLMRELVVGYVEKHTVAGGR